MLFRSQIAIEEALPSSLRSNASPKGTYSLRFSSSGDTRLSPYQHDEENFENVMLCNCPIHPIDTEKFLMLHSVNEKTPLSPADTLLPSEEELNELYENFVGDLYMTKGSALILESTGVLDLEGCSARRVIANGNQLYITPFVSKKTTTQSHIDKVLFTSEAKITSSLINTITLTREGRNHTPKLYLIGSEVSGDIDLSSGKDRSSLYIENKTSVFGSIKLPGNGAIYIKEGSMVEGNITFPMDNPGTVYLGKNSACLGQIINGEVRYL